MISSENYFHWGFFSGFATNKTELNAVFDIFDKDNKYYMQYSEFIEALKPDRHVSTKNYEF
jgi:Ca2+-binding EF-hand superfamily protein